MNASIAVWLHGRYTYPGTGGSPTVSNSAVALIGPAVVVDRGAVVAGCDVVVDRAPEVDDATVTDGAVVAGSGVVVDGALEVDEMAKTDVALATPAERGSGSMPAQALSTMAVTTDVAPREPTVRSSPG